MRWQVAALDGATDLGASGGYYAGMSDERLRELERRWKALGSVQNEAAYLLVDSQSHGPPVLKTMDPLATRLR